MKTVYQGKAVWTNELIKCPVCLGHQKVIVHAIGGPDRTVKCDFCKHTNGMITDHWTYKPVVVRIDVGAIESIRTSGSSEKITYRFNMSGNGYNSVPAEDCDDTEEDAMRRAIKLTAEANMKGFDEPLKNPTWDLGYHEAKIQEKEQEIRILQGGIDYHKEQLGL